MQGKVPLVINVEGADAIAALLRLKAEVEEESSTTLRFVFAGAAEAHILAPEIAHAGAGVILTPSRPFPNLWEQRRMCVVLPLRAECVRELIRGLVDCLDRRSRS